MADLNLVALTGFATRDAALRHKNSGQVKAEFSFEVERPFLRATGEPVSDLFLVDVWEDLGRWAVDHIKQGTRLLVIGTLNKESYSTRSGREHLTIVKAKYIKPLDGTLLESELDLDEMRRDSWSEEMLLAAVRLVERALQDSRESEMTEAAEQE
ncbi:MAG: single-stranded DNA-binding protein [Armatimonadetes bacterium]|nr:single-stranded DNA-binding protein [Armatimonadota bacterium]